MPEACDSGILRYLPSVQNLAIDCLEHIKNEDQLAALSQLRRLSFQVNALDRPQFLATLNLAELEVLTLMGTRKANLDLKPVSQARRLRRLTVEGHRRGIESLSDAPSIEDLILWGQRSLNPSRLLPECPSSMKWNKAARAQHDALGYQGLGESWHESDLDEVYG